MTDLNPVDAMTTDYRAICAELHTAIQLYTGQNPAAANVSPSELVCRLMDAMAASAAALDQPTPQPVAEGPMIPSPYRGHEIAVYRDGFHAGYKKALSRSANPTLQPVAVAPYREVADSVVRLEDHSAECLELDQPKWSKSIAQAARFLHLYLKVTPQPVAVSERWPEFSDCDPQERVWAWNPVLDHWKLSRINLSVHTHWLPANALPLPAGEGAS